MEKLSLSLDKELEVMKKWGLNGDQWMFVRLLFMALDPNSQPQYLARYVNECAKTGVARHIIVELRNKGIIDKSYKVPAEGSVFVLSDVKFSASFEKSYFKLSGEAGQELFDAYPHYMYMDNGKILPLRNITKGGFMTLDDFFLAYSKAIRYDRSQHELVMESLEFAKENNLITYGMVEYVASMKWNDHMKMMKDDQIGKFSVKFDTIETV